MKRFLSITLCVMMAASLFAVNVSAAISPTYTVVEGACEEAIYASQDFSNTAVNTDFTQNASTTHGDVSTVTVDSDTGVLQIRGVDSSGHSAHLKMAGTVTSGEFVVEYDLKKNDSLTDTMNLYINVKRGANQSSSDANLKRYGVLMPAKLLESGVWYNFRVTFSESAYISGNDVKYFGTAQYKKATDTSWTNMTHQGSNAPTRIDVYRSAGSGLYGKTDVTADVTMFLYSYDGAVSNSKNASDVSYDLDNIKIYTPESAGTATEYTYPIADGVCNWLDTAETVINNYSGGNANPYDKKYTDKATAPTADNGVVNRVTFTFDAINTVKGMPLTVHVGGNTSDTSNDGTGFDILSNDKNFNTWYTYKAVYEEKWNENGNKFSLVDVYRKTATGDWESCSRLTRENGTFNIESADIYNNGSLSSGAGKVCFSWNAQRGTRTPIIAYSSTDEGFDLGNTSWTVKDMQVTTNAYIAGKATADGGKVTLDADFVAGSFPATAIMAVYGADGALKDIDYVKYAAGIGAADLEADYAAGDTVKLYIWDSFDAGTPFLASALDITSTIQ